jgi:hypothetical protein
MTIISFRATNFCWAPSMAGKYLFNG